jgi:hypothetical protein
MEVPRDCLIPSLGIAPPVIFADALPDGAAEPLWSVPLQGVTSVLDAAAAANGKPAARFRRQIRCAKALRDRQDDVARERHSPGHDPATYPQLLAVAPGGLLTHSSYTTPRDTIPSLAESRSQERATSYQRAIHTPVMKLVERRFSGCLSSTDDADGASAS